MSIKCLWYTYSLLKVAVLIDAPLSGYVPITSLAGLLHYRQHSDQWKRPEEFLLLNLFLHIQ